MEDKNIHQELRTWFEKESKKPAIVDEKPTSEYTEWVEKKFEEVRNAYKGAADIIRLNL